MIGIVVSYIIGINIVGHIMMGVDKRKARKHAWRIPEKTLWITAIIGGAFGSFLGMKSFRHKTKHTLFRIGMPLLMIIQFIFYVYILSMS